MSRDAALTGGSDAMPPTMPHTAGRGTTGTGMPGAGKIVPPRGGDGLWQPLPLRPVPSLPPLPAVGVAMATSGPAHASRGGAGCRSGSEEGVGSEEGGVGAGEGMGVDVARGGSCPLRAAGDVDVGGTGGTGGAVTGTVVAEVGGTVDAASTGGGAEAATATGT